jgi:hypothetical protein
MLFLVDGTTVAAATERCTDGDGWTYFATNDDPEDYVFAIKKNGNTFSATVTIHDETLTETYVSTNGTSRGTFLIGRTWDVNILSGGIDPDYPVDVRFYVDMLEVEQAFTEASAFLLTALSGSNLTPLTFFKHPDSAFDPATMMTGGDFNFTPSNTWAFGTTSPFSPSGTSNSVAYYELTGITSFSGGSGGFSINDGSPTLLPVELISFTARAVDDKFVQLDWTTATEINNDRFEVQRSFDGLSFTTIGIVQGNGNSSQPISYRLNDNEPQRGVNYYRLKQIDYDETFEFSRIVSAVINSDVSLFSVANIRPNPASDKLHIDIRSSGKADLNLTFVNNLGQPVKKSSSILQGSGKETLVIDIQDLPAGVYHVQISGQLKTELHRIIVVK